MVDSRCADVRLPHGGAGAGFPIWESDETSVSSVKMGMVAHYTHMNLALHDGYKPFHPTGRVGEEVHYTNYRFARKEQKAVDYRHPGSILFKRTADGMKAVGVMYTAPPDSTAEQLNAIAPLSVATWHRHVDFCGGSRALPLSTQFGPGAPFGPEGTIHTVDACKAAHGLWIPVVFGWMTHVYLWAPTTRIDLQAFFGP